MCFSPAETGQRREQENDWALHSREDPKKEILQYGGGYERHNFWCTYHINIRLMWEKRSFSLEILFNFLKIENFHAFLIILDQQGSKELDTTCDCLKYGSP